MKTAFRIAVLLSVAALVGACATRSAVDLRGLEPAATIDLDRYMGRWYVIAHIPYLAENGKVGTYVEYSQRADGKIDDYFFFRKRNFAAEIERWEGYGWVLPDTGNAVWKTRFVWPLTVDYVILDVDPDYRWALVGHPKRDLAWIFHRDPQMDPALYAQLLERLEAHGYDPEALRRVPQVRDQLGQAGFAE